MDERVVRPELKKAGTSLFDTLYSQRNESPKHILRLRRRNLENLASIKSIIVVGSSNAGKTSIVNHIRGMLAQDPKLRDIFEVPKRVVTRPIRDNDDLTENIFETDSEKFKKLTDGGVVWERDMGDGRKEKYGFVRVAEDKIPVYSANNAITDKKTSKKPFLDSALIITVYAPDELRKSRLHKRSADLVKERPDEVRMRLRDRGMSQYRDAHILLKNKEGHLSDTREAAARLLRAVGDVAAGQE